MNELEKLKQAMASIEVKMKEVKADMEEGPDSVDSKMSSMMGYCCDMVNNLRQYVYRVEDAMYSKFSDHSIGHLPPINGAGKMEKALEKLGIAEDYNISKPTIWVSASRNGKKEYNVTLPALKK